MYSQIAANKRKSALIMSIFIMIIASLGLAFGFYMDSQGAAYAALIFALFYCLISYYTSSKLALAVNGAKQVSKSDEPRLYRMVENLSIATGMPTPKVYIVDDTAPNAFATGRNPETASIAVTRGLMAALDDKELEGVLAHEMAHVQNYDIRVMMVAFACVSVIGVISDFALRMVIGSGGGRGKNRGSSQGTLILAALAILAPIAAFVVQMAVSRHREYLADATGALTTRYPEGLASALRKIDNYGPATSKQNRSTAHLYFANPISSKFFSKLHSTHPPTSERIARLEKMGGSL